ncbi:MAG TPA: glycosyltransferase family 25 protein [Rhabdochlamydiaceae bacterium]|nr:glycosyltransferase family 25 protein [Rhabdochlamydiaceae bacterium]
MNKFFFTTFLVCQLFASNVPLEESFKKVEHNEFSSPVRNIDFIYMINLDQRPEKFQKSLEQLAPYGIVPYRFSAVNGWELTMETINNVGVTFEPWMVASKMGTYYPLGGDGEPQHEVVQTPGRTYFGHCMSRGAIGIVLSHLSILQDAYDRGYQTIWVMEDDIEIIQSPHILSELIDQLDTLVGKEGWDILFTDQDTKGQNGMYVPCGAYAWKLGFNPPNPNKCQERYDISPLFRRVGSRYGAYSMIIRQSGMKKLLDFFKRSKIFLPFDMEFTFPPTIQLVTVIHDVVSTLPQALSDNGSPNYKKKN